MTENTINNRLDKIMKTYSRSNNHFETKHKLGRGLVGKAIKGGNNVGAVLLIAITKEEEFSNINIDWLLRGRGEMIKASGDSSKTIKTFSIDKVIEGFEERIESLEKNEKYYAKLLRQYNASIEELDVKLDDLEKKSKVKTSKQNN